MKTLTLARHGAYNSRGTGELTDDGRIQIEELAESIQPHISGTIRVVSSDMLRAIESAQIVASALDVPYSQEDQFEDFFMYEEPQHIERIMTLIASLDTVDSLIVMAHELLVRHSSEAYAEQKVGMTIPEIWAPYGRGIVIDTEKKELFRV